MSYSEKGEILACFICSTIYPNKFDLSNYKYINFTYTYVEINDIKVIKTSITSDKKKCLICKSFPDTKGYCVNYTIDDNSFFALKNYGLKCRERHFSSSLGYMRETNQFIFSYLSDDGIIAAQIFDQNFSPIYDLLNIFHGYSENGASIIYSYDLGNYYLISDVDSASTNNKSIIISNSIVPSTYVYAITGETEKEEIPTTIITIIPTTILTTIPTTILTTIPTTILTTIPTTILTTIPSTIFTTIPTIIQEEIPFIWNLEKCLTCNQKSFLNFSNRFLIECFQFFSK